MLQIDRGSAREALDIFDVNIAHSMGKLILKCGVFSPRSTLDSTHGFLTDGALPSTLPTHPLGELEGTAFSNSESKKSLELFVRFLDCKFQNTLVSGAA